MRSEFVEKKIGKEPVEIKVNIKAVIPGTAVVLLENGDTIVLQIFPTNIRFVVGPKDANGNPVYNFEIQQQLGVIGKNAKALPPIGVGDGKNTAADADGRNSEQPG